MPGRIAPLSMAWRRRMGSLAGPLSASGEASNGNPVQIEMYIGGSWVDITAYVMVRDDNGNISVTRGRRDEGSTTEQASLQLQLNNRDGRWSPRNPSGVYYGQIGRNTPIRVSVPNGLGGKSYRFQGEVASWPQGWDPTGTDVWTDLEASGILRRLSQGPPPAHSVLYEALTAQPSSSLRAYWPMEDPSGSATLASALVSGSRMTYTGTPDLATFEQFPASDPVPDMTSTVFSGGVPTYTDPTATQVRFFLFIPSDGLTQGTVVCSIDQVDYSAGSTQFWELYYGNFGSTGHSLTLRQNASDGTELGAELESTYDVRGKKLYVSVEFQESGTSITRAVRLYDLDQQISYDTTDTATLTQLTRVTRVQFGPASRSAVGPYGTTGMSAVAVGHVTVEDAITSNTILGVHLNPVGEKAGRRVQRICSEEGIAFESIGDLDDTVSMGTQTKLNPLDQMQEAELADGGMLYESMPMLGLGYRTRAALCNQDAQLTLNYAGFNLAQVPTPVEDDRYVQNQVTVTVSGISQTYALTEGALSTELPPGGVGVYGTDVTLNLQDTDEALSQAAWRVHLGTVDEPRYPQISVNLAHSTFTSNPALKQAVLGLRQGDRVVVQNPPSWLPPGNIDQIILGFDETITHFEHRITFICAPASPYNTMGVLDDGVSHLDTDGTVLLSAVTTSDTKLVVVPTQLGGTLWTTDDTDCPFDVRFGGEVATVTANSSAVYDSFSRTVSNGWGSANTGQSWTVVGSAADYAVGSGIGTTTFPTTGIAHLTLATSPTADVDVAVNIATSALATGASLFGGILVRAADNNNHYMARLEFTTSAGLILTVRKRVGGTETSLGSFVPTDAHVAGTYYRIRFQAYGSTLKAKVWNYDNSPVEPTDWPITVTDTSIGTADNIGTRGFSNSGNTNVNPVVQYDFFDLHNVQTFTVTRSVNGIVKAHSAGEDVRLAYPTYVSL